MRDPRRIEPFLAKFERLWRQVPDQRFGQLIMNLTRDEHGNFLDPWDWEEDDWEAAFERWAAEDHHDPTNEEIKARVERLIDLLGGGG